MEDWMLLGLVMGLVAAGWFAYRLIWRKEQKRKQGFEDYRKGTAKK